MVKGACIPLVQVCARLGERERYRFYQTPKVMDPYISTRVKDYVLPGQYSGVCHGSETTSV